MSFLRKIGLSKKVQIISIELNGDDDNPIFHFLSAKKKRTEIVVIKNLLNISLEEIQNSFKKNIPILIHFSGKGILSRKTIFTNDYREKLILNEDINEFYFSELKKDELIYISFVRKKIIDQIIAQIKSLKIEPIDFVIGPFVTQINSLPEKILSTPLWTFEYQDDKLFDFRKEISHKSIYFLDNKIDNNIYALALSYSFFQQTIKNLSCEIEKQKINLKRFTDQRQFNSIGIFMLVFFLTILCSNYFFMSYLNQKNADLESEIMVYGNNLAKIDLLDQEKIRKRQLILSSGINSKHLLSFYIDKLAQTVPNSIQFSELNVFPAVKNLKQKVKLELNQDEIIVVGNTSNSSYIDQWIKLLKAEKWIAKCEILNLENLTTYTIFTLKLTVK